jgi:YidC/Oxa1 family membrane protein insertase
VGIFNPLYDAISWIILLFHSAFEPIFGAESGVTWSLAIVFLVVLIRIILIPLFVKQIKSQRALTVLQPEMKAIQQKYKDDRQKQSEEMMKLYKKHGTNPLASCFPLLAQAPIFFALFTVLNGIAQDVPRGVLSQADVDSAANAKFFGAPIAATFLMGSKDIEKLGGTPTTVKIITLVMILLMSASTFITQRQLMVKGMPKNDGQPNMMLQQQKILLYLFPIIFAVTGINFPVGVLLYWLTTNLWTMGQQFYVIKRNPTPGSPAYFELEAKRAKKAGGAPTPESSEGTNNGSLAVEEPKGQRQQPKKDKNKKKKKR